MPTVYIIIYSVYHHIYTLAKEVQKGLESEGVTVKLFQVRYIHASITALMTPFII